MPQVRPTRGVRAHLRQALAVGWTSFASILKSKVGVLLLALVAVLAALSVAEPLSHLGVPLHPRTDLVLRALTVPEIGPGPWVIVPLLIVFWAGELVWRERDAGLDAIVDAAPAPEWVHLVGKLGGLGLVLAACMALRMAAGVLVQAGAGYYEFEVGLYLAVLFGLHLPHYLLLALLALVAHVVVSQKAVGHLVTVVAFALIAAASVSGIGHELAVYGAAPEWSYSDMRGFGASLGPRLWFTGYWAAWALLLAVGARLLWVRGRAGGIGTRLRLARGRLTRPTAWVAGAAAGLVVLLGGFIFANTNVRNDYRTVFDRMDRAAEYERQYGRYEGVPQPRLTGIRLDVDLFPERRAAEVRGRYRLVNRSAVPIDTVHVATVPDVVTGEATFGRPAAPVRVDEDLGHRIYALATPLLPGDSLEMAFEVRVEPRGFRTNEALPAEAAVAANGTWFTNRDWLPALGYDPDREIPAEGERRARGLPPRPRLPSLDDEDARQPAIGAERVAFEAVVSTDEGQTAIAPGALRRSWTEGGRRFYHYVAESPIQNGYAVFSADYAVLEGEWTGASGSGQPVAIQIFHHPAHTANLDRMVEAVRWSLDYLGEQFGPYPHGQIRLVERPGLGIGLSAEAVNMAYQEGFSLLSPDEDPRGLDLVSAIVAHEVAHQWWGLQVTPASVEGSVVLTESLAWYSALRAIEAASGSQELRRLLQVMREPFPYAPVRAAPPLLRASGPYLGYRKGPFALYALSETVGEERVNDALRQLVARHGAGASPLPTSLNLYRELRAVTPDTLRPLLRDLFERNVFWELATESASTQETASGDWRVTLDVRARKVKLDEDGVETEVPMDDWVEIGAFARAQGDALSAPLYVGRHRVRSGEQTITVTVPRRPVRAGIDPYHLLDWEGRGSDNTRAVEVATGV